MRWNLISDGNKGLISKGQSWMDVIESLKEHIQRVGKVFYRKGE